MVDSSLPVNSLTYFEETFKREQTLTYDIFSVVHRLAFRLNIYSLSESQIVVVEHAFPNLWKRRKSNRFFLPHLSLTIQSIPGPPTLPSHRNLSLFTSNIVTSIRQFKEEYRSTRMTGP